MENLVSNLTIILLLVAIIVSILRISKKQDAYSQLKIVSDSGEVDNTEKFRTALLDKLDLLFKSLTERIDQIHQFMGSVPYHNTTFYFNYRGEPLNLNVEKWRLEIEQDPKQYIKDNAVGKLVIYIRRNDIIFDKFALDFKTFDKNHKSFPVVEYGVKLMKESKLNYAQLTFEMLKELIEGAYSRQAIYHQQFVNALIYSFIQHVTPLYEIEQAQIKNEEETKKLVTERAASGESDYKCKIGEEVKEYDTCSANRDEYIGKERMKILEYMGSGDIYTSPETHDKYTGLHFWKYPEVIKAGINKAIADGAIDKEKIPRDQRVEALIDSVGDQGYVMKDGTGEGRTPNIININQSGEAL